MGSEDKTIPPNRAPQPAASSNLEGNPLSLSGFKLVGSAFGENSDFGDYILLEEIARGGMGVVFKARQKKLDRVCALKMILSGQLAGEGEIERFYDEARAAAHLEHPGIVPVFEVGEVNDQHFYSMGFVEGHILQNEINAGPIEIRRSAMLARQVSHAIAYAHQNSVIHRDLKPANVLIDESGDAHVTDFGLAKIKSRPADSGEQGTALGTPSYMAPEQAGGDFERVDEKSDVYSIGAILFCMLTGGPPFSSASSMDTMLQVLEKEPVAPTQINPDVPKDLEAITLKCLEKNASRRYQSAQDLADDLECFLDGKPIAARKLSEHDRWVKWCMREPWLATAVVSMMIFGALIIASIAINPNLIREMYHTWADSVVACGVLLGMFISIVGFAVFQTIKTIRDQSGIVFGLIRVLTVIPVGVIGLSIVVGILRILMMMVVPDYDIFYSNPQDKDLQESLKDIPFLKE